jgi:hypothetical protein
MAGQDRDPWWKFPLGLAVPALIVVLGWCVVNDQTAAREAENKRREIRAQYLIEAYRKIEGIAFRPGMVKPRTSEAQAVETAFADVQLFGDDEQRRLVKAIINDIERASKSDPRPLLSALRRDLRRELKLPSAPSDPLDILHFRVAEPSPPGAQPK